MDAVDPADTDEAVDTTPDVPDTPADTDIFFDTDPAASGVWSHDHRVDGSLADWYATEQVGPTQADGSRAYVSWDGAYLYFAVSNPTLTTAPASRMLVVLLGNGTGGSHEVPAVGGQSPSLPFGAVRVVQWRLSGENVVYYLIDDAWDPRPDFVGTGGSYISFNREAGGLEVGLSRGSFQIVGLTIDIAWFWVDDTPGAEVSMSAVPALNFADGAFDPDLISWYRFRTDFPDAPARYTPIEAP